MEENKMGVRPVKKLLITMSVPMMISMLVQALYNIVDSVFVAQVSEDAVTALAAAFPMQNLLISLGMGTCVGVNALLSKGLGAKDQEAADNAANMGLLLSAVHYVFFMCVGLLSVSVFVRSQTDNPSTIAYAISYLRIICVLSFGCFFQVMMERLLQSTGRTHLSMISQTSGALINILFDYILIFGHFGFPRMEVAGAAVATCIGQICAACIGLFLNLKFNPEVHLSIKRILKPHVETVKKIYLIGVPSMLMMAIGTPMTYCMNRITGMFSEDGMWVFGSYFKLQSFFFMPVFGLNNGLIPILAYNYGAKKKARIKEGLKFAVVLGVCIMLVGTLVFNVFPKNLLLLFKANSVRLKIGIPALRTIGLSYPMAAVAIMLGSVFQAFAKSKYSFFISIARQLVVLIPVAWLLAQTGNINNVWWAFPIAEIVSLSLTVVFFRKVKAQVIDSLPDLQ
ncbi:putative efflux protein, MATE family [Oscillospiraceae bacterium]|nr:putative efflux protein, MATE family [Oscillospiraceae bacterium]